MGNRGRVVLGEEVGMKEWMAVGGGVGSCDGHIRLHSGQGENIARLQVMWVAYLFWSRWGVHSNRRRGLSMLASAHTILLPATSPPQRSTSKCTTGLKTSRHIKLENMEYAHSSHDHVKYNIHPT